MDLDVAPSNSDSQELGVTRSKRMVQVKPHPQEYASTRYENRRMPAPVSEELDALEDFRREWCKHQDDHGSRKHRKEILIVELSDFEIYRSPGPDRNEYEFVPLHQFDVKTKSLSLNGFLTLGSVRRYVEFVSINDFSIEGYDDEKDPDIVTYIQSVRAAKDREYDVWYRLSNRATAAYQPFLEPFLWVAQLGKHVADYISSKPETTVGLRAFHHKFHRWLLRRFGDEPVFRSWLSRCGRTDFRFDVNAFIDYLYNQVYNLPNARILLTHPIWGECLRGEAAGIEQQPILCRKTIATPFVYDCFRNMYFGKFLERMDANQEVRREQNARARALGFAVQALQPPNCHHQPFHQVGGMRQRQTQHRFFQVGDIVGIGRDEEGHWKTSDNEWLAFVQGVEPAKSGTQRLLVLWLYRPTDTTISTMSYPIKKEMFFSDNCNCTESILLSTDITRTYSVDWFPKDLNTTKDVLIRQKYVTQDSAFVTLKSSDYLCQCRTAKESKRVSYERGDCVYMTKRSGEHTQLEPVVICHTQEDTGEATVLQLLRLKSIINELSTHPERTIAPNHLVWTDNTFVVSTRRLQRKCHVRFFQIDVISNGRVPVPYNRDGNGDFWFFCSILLKGDGQWRLEHLFSPPSHLRQGFDPEETPEWKPLKGLSIFSGGGNLDRGLEDGGAVDFVTAIDISGEAVHTQLANAPPSGSLKVYWGSVDDYLKALLSGSSTSPIVRIGDIQLIAAGSPCPGFSVMQPNWKSNGSLRNASHITTLCSYLDVLRPEYAVLENVVSMANTRKGHEEEKVFSQVIACFVALGYQVSQHLMDSWNYGSSQHRSRLFITLAAPNVDPLPQPWLTHSHPEQTNGRALGKLANGESFGCREKYPTPFRFVTAEESVADLPEIGSGLVQTCPSFPDHRVVYPMNGKDRALMKRIPTSSPGKGYVDAMGLDLIPTGLMKNKKIPGHLFRRIKAAGQIRTITTIISPQDSRCGTILHWTEPRTLTIQEARRAQSIPDHEVIIGSMAAQWRVIGNGVDRNVALALGLSLRRAWESSYNKGSSYQRKVAIHTNNARKSTTVHQTEKSIRRMALGVVIPSKQSPLLKQGKRARPNDGNDGDEPTQSTSEKAERKKKLRYTGLESNFANISWDKVPQKELTR